MIDHLTQALQRLDIPAEWVGLRATKTQTSAHMVRDGHPERNGHTLTQGVMVEVLANGQFGYCATNQL